MRNLILIALLLQGCIIYSTKVIAPPRPDDTGVPAEDTDPPYEYETCEDRGLISCWIINEWGEPDPVAGRPFCAESCDACAEGYGPMPEDCPGDSG